FYFTLSNTQDYTGGNYGQSNNYARYSKPSTKITAPDFPGLLMDYSEVEFLLAEAASRGFGVEGTAEEHYNKAITASIEYWGGTEEQAKAYLSQPGVAWSTAEGDWKEKIGVQKWIALYNRGFDAWTEWRRLDYPELTPPPGMDQEDIPVRFTYPVLEQNLNTVNYEAAAGAIGGDVISTRLFWDLN
ncbi:MAG TPA: SusD/RagB family nutrient-binding outer membrane lipoprotein, partial [Chitinophagaceae bacterium]|nr:SusD/RagB family nutrient-binding outer membrane lipoprotein [Chitinophagaceae bacterium]